MPIFVTPGDPMGVGAEISVRALAQTEISAVVIGDSIFLDQAKIWGLKVKQIKALSEHTTGVSFLKPLSKEPIEVSSIRLGVDGCLKIPHSALVTGPIHKAKLAEQGFPYPGHTDFLGYLCGVKNPVMAFVGGKLRVSLVTVHIPITQVSKHLTSEKILDVIKISADALINQLGICDPRLAICGLNPHAGDQGLIGTEEIEIIGPTCELARKNGFNVTDPVSIETAVRLMLEGNVDHIVAMYHDQGLAPLKAVDFGHSVNWTLGLPIIRTSVDHGTAYDIANKGIADFGSMKAALLMAQKMIYANSCGIPE